MNLPQVNSESLGLKDKTQTKKPPLYKVVLLKDDYTPMDFVMLILKKIFNFDDLLAHNIMMKIHNEGRANCGIFVKEIAETKSFEVNNLAQTNEHPLKSIIEPCEE